MTRAPSVPELEDWWRHWPDANVGVVTGRISRLAVVDIDPRNGGDRSLRVLEAEHGLLPITAEVRTGGSGRHLWFASDGDAPSSTIAPGVDLKAAGGMVVAPPSIHASGRRYEWRPGGDPGTLALAPLPGWLEELAVDGGISKTRAEGEPPVRTAREQADFAAVWANVGIHLQPGDRYYLCPFHDDHEPSLHVDAEGCRWYCFGCEIGGGVGRLRQLVGGSGRRRPTSMLRGADLRGGPVTIHGHRSVEVVGESRHQDELLELTGGRRRYGGVDVEVVAELVPDPTNPYDPSAIEVRIDDRPIGFVRREDHTWLWPLVDESLDLHGRATCLARIRGGWDRGRGEVGRFGVTLLLPLGE